MELLAEEVMCFENALHCLRILKKFHDAGYDVSFISRELFTLNDGYSSEYSMPYHFLIDMVKDLFPFALEIYHEYMDEEDCREQIQSYLNVIPRLDFDAIPGWTGLEGAINSANGDTKVIKGILNTHFNYSYVIFIEANINDIGIELDFCIRGKENDCFALIFDEDAPYEFEDSLDGLIDFLVTVKKNN